MTSVRDSSEEENNEDDEYEEDDDEEPAAPVCTYSECIKGPGCIRKGSVLEACGLCKTMSVHSACMPGFRRFGKHIDLYSHLRTAVLCFACASDVVNKSTRDVQRGKGPQITGRQRMRAAPTAGSPSAGSKRKGAGAGGAGGAGTGKRRRN